MSTMYSCRRTALSALLAFSMTPTLFAQVPTQNIFKCVNGETTAYQSMPCGGGQTEARVMTIARAEIPSPSVAVPIPSASAVVPTARTPGKMWPPRRTLMLGMSDDEVLNLAGWGVPKRISRTKGQREWREEWFYPTSNGDRRLSFVNGTLVDALIDPETSQAATQVATERRAYPAT